jgi:hypothetical protein
MSRSILNVYQAEQLQQLRAMQLSTLVFFQPEYGVTIVVETPASDSEVNTARFGVALCSPNEDMFNAEVGEYNARKRLYCGEVSVTVIRDDWANWAESLAFAVGYGM